MSSEENSMRRGYAPNLKRHRLIIKHRAAGMTYQAIADQLGVTAQTVYETLQRNGYARAIPISCHKCKVVISEMRMATNNNGPVYCMKCLPRTASFGQRLKACRLAVGLTLTGLGKQTGMPGDMIGRYEQGRVLPTWDTIAKLIRVFGVEWLDIRSPGGPAKSRAK
jgi:transcriptional regulator with XRE-family HTH domain